MLLFTKNKAYTWRHYRLLLLAPLPFIILTFLVKIYYAPPNDIFNAQVNRSLLSRLMEVERYRKVSGAFVQGSMVFGGFHDVPVLLFLLGYLLVTGIDKDIKLP